MIEQHGLLRKTFVGNAVFSFLSGLAMLLWNDWVSEYVGVAYPFILIVVGVGLILFSIGIGMIARIRNVRKFIVWSIVVLDLLWVIGSGVLLGMDVLTTVGNILTVVVASIVLFLALMQMIGIQKSEK